MSHIVQLLPPLTIFSLIMLPQLIGCLFHKQSFCTSKSAHPPFPTTELIGALNAELTPYPLEEPTSDRLGRLLQHPLATSELPFSRQLDSLMSFSCIPLNPNDSLGHVSFPYRLRDPTPIAQRTRSNGQGACVGYFDRKIDHHDHWSQKIHLVSKLIGLWIHQLVAYLTTIHCFKD
jgi:hypothetical protein